MTSIPFNSPGGFSTGLTATTIITQTGGITAANLFVSGGATFNSNISAPNIVNSVNGATGNAYASEFFLGYTSTANYYTFPDGNTGNFSGSQTAWYQTSMTFWSPSNQRRVRPNRIYFAPFVVGRTVDIQAIKVNINSSTSGITGNVYFGIYDVNSAGFPQNALFVGSVPVPASSSGFVTLTISAGNAIIPPGAYWMASSWSLNQIVTTWNMPAIGATQMLPQKQMGGGYYATLIVAEPSGFTMPSNTSGLTLGLVDFALQGSTDLVVCPIMEWRVR
jgi:hypothetical protein